MRANYRFRVKIKLDCTTFNEEFKMNLSLLLLIAVDTRFKVCSPVKAAHDCNYDFLEDKERQFPVCILSRLVSSGIRCHQGNEINHCWSLIGFHSGERGTYKDVVLQIYLHCHFCG